MIAASLVFISVFSLCTVLGLVVLLSIDRTSRMRRARIVRYSPQNEGGDVLRAQARLRALAPPTSAPGSRLGALGQLAQLYRRRLKEAGLEMGVDRLLTIGLLLAAVLIAPALVIGPFPPIVSALVGLIVAYMGVNIVLDMKKRQRVNAFNADLPAVLDIMARSVRAGQPVASAIKVVTQYTSGIAHDEFERCAEQLRLGMTLDEALMRMAQSVDTAEIRFISAAIKLQTETGGNLIETLENIALMLRERAKLMKKASAMSAEARVSATILSLLPFVVAVLMLFLNPGYLTTLFTDPRGIVMLMIGGALLALGIMSMYKLAKIEV